MQTATVKKYKSIIKKKKKKHNEKVLLTKFKLDSTEGLISKTLINSRITGDEFVLINNQLKECNNMNEEKIKDFNSSLKILVYL